MASMSMRSLIPAEYEMPTEPTWARSGPAGGQGFSGSATTIGPRSGPLASLSSAMEGLKSGKPEVGVRGFSELGASSALKSSPLAPALLSVEGLESRKAGSRFTTSAYVRGRGTAEPGSAAPSAPVSMESRE